jgi:periplasmic protein TonB
MKAISFLIYSLSLTFSLAGQQKASKSEDRFYMLDENYKNVAIEKAKFFVHAVKENDTCWQFDTYNISGPLVSSEQYKDEKATILHGQSVYFNAKGTRDSIDNFQNDLPNGSFYYLNDTGKIYIQKEFRKGVLVETIDRIKKDSIDKIVMKSKSDTTKVIEVESTFPGGKGSWGRYLTKNLVYPERAQKLEKQGTVVLQFIVDTEGHIYNQEIIQSVEYSLDQEAMRMIKESPAWIPAFQKGKKVKSYKRQPLIFKLSSN